MKTRFYILLLLLVTGNCLSGQAPAFVHYETGNGLPANEIYEMKQDRKGFLWIGCEAGLVRYDGNRFRLLLCNRNRGTAISNLQEDSYGRIWCINFSGQVFYTEGDSLRLFEPWEKNYRSGFADIAIDRNDQLYICNQQNRIYKYDIRSGRSVIVVSDSLFKRSPFIAADGSVLFTLLDSGVAKKITPTGAVSIPRQLNGKIQATRFLLNNLVFYNSFHGRHTLAFQRYNPGNDKPWLYQFRDNRFENHPASALLQQLNIYLLSVFDDDNGNLFIGSSNELLWLKQNSAGEWRMYKRLLQGNSISYICKDRESNIWISTLKNGLYKMPDTSIWTLVPDQRLREVSGINHLSTDGKGTLFAAALNGHVFSYDTRGGRFTLLDSAEKRDVQAMRYNTINHSLYVSRNKIIKLDPASRKSVILADVANSKDIFFRKDGVVFFTGTELCAFSGGNKNTMQELEREFITVELKGAFLPKERMLEKSILSAQRSTPVWYDEEEKTLWTGFVDGVAFSNNRQWVKLYDPETKQPVVASAFTGGPQNQLIIASIERGIYLVKNRKIVRQFSTSQGLLSNRIKAMRCANNRLWAICGPGIQCIDLETGVITCTLTVTDGLLSSENYDIEIINDTVYAASSKGIQFFPAAIHSKNEVAPVSMISGIWADGKTLLPGSKMELDYNTRNLVISLQGIALKSDGRFTYQYRLLPSDTSWISVSANENVVRFSSLSPGKYQFQGRVLNEDGVMSRETSVQSFLIKKPWWLQWWFLLLLALCIAAVVYTIFRNRLKATQRKNEEQLEQARIQEQLRSSQLTSLKAQMNPHFMFNALNSIQEFILLNDKRQANAYMGKFADLMRMTLDMSNRDKVSLEEEMRVLDLYLQLETLRFENEFTSSLTTAPGINPDHIFLPAMLIQPHIENAIKHGLLHKQGTRNLSVHFSLEGNTLSCSIHDNGIGRKRSSEINAQRLKKHTSFATGATQQRLQLLNYERNLPIGVHYEDLYEAGQPSGTRVIINIPL